MFLIKRLLSPALNLNDIKSTIFKVQAGLLASSLPICYFYCILLLKANRAIVLPGHKHKDVIFYISVLSKKKDPHLA